MQNAECRSQRADAPIRAVPLTSTFAIRHSLFEIPEGTVNKVAFAVGAHPDDIEFMMGGTMLLLGRAGWRLHYMAVASGSCGTTSLGRRRIVALRTKEARAAARALGAAYHPPLVDDFEIYYEPQLLRRLAAIVRHVRPQVLLLPSPLDYMEDHVHTARLMVTAAFTRSMPNFRTTPPRPPVAGEVAVYHALPYGLRDPLRRPVRPEFFVDIAPVLPAKRQALACHRSQKEWLDASQSVDSYLQAMVDMSAAVGRMSRKFQHAEGWTRHSHLGFGPEGFDPLRRALAGRVWPPIKKTRDHRLHRLRDYTDKKRT
jgi:LmbE family N-acetylglucosaminyl deacetylase